MAFVLPGEPVPVPSSSGASAKPLILGPGLLHVSSGADRDGGVGRAADVTIATRPGVLGSRKGVHWWLESNAKRYVPAPQESVIGIITNKHAEGYRVDIGGAHNASLDALAFEGATKRNKPNLKIGSIVYARVSLAHKDMEPELECFDAQTRKAGGFGELRAGFLVNCSLGTCRALLDPKHFLIPLFGARFPLEIVTGMNGRVWVSTEDPRHTIALARCIEAVDQRGLDAAGVHKFMNTLDI